MELEAESGSKILIEPGSDTLIGRELGLGFGPSGADRTVSRRHLSLRLIDDTTDKFRVEFVVIGKNPIWVCFSNGGDRRTYKNLEKGELRTGDKLSLSIKKPSFWVVKRSGGENEEDEEERKRVLDAVARREKRTLERKEKKDGFRGEDADSSEEIGAVDVSQIDPVKEFGFLVKGHEFDQYPKKRIVAAKNWNWFLEELCENSDDNETIDGSISSKRKKGSTRKKKKGGIVHDDDDDDDDEWTGDSNDEKEVVVEGGRSKRPKYPTRSKDPKIPRKVASGSRNRALRKNAKVEEEDEEDETLGGFIVDEEEEEEDEEEVVEDEESEDEFDDEEEDEEE